MRTMTTISSDAGTVTNSSQRFAAIVHGIYSLGEARQGRKDGEAKHGPSGVANIASETGRG
jgi:hypothetical protein